MLRTLADLLRDAVTANRTGDVALARRTLDRARETEYSLGPAARGHPGALGRRRRCRCCAAPARPRARRDAHAATVLDLAVRNARVLVRRADVAIEREDPVPEEVLRLVADLAGVVDQLAAGYDDPAQQPLLRRELTALAERSSTFDVPQGLSGATVLAQARSLVTDLLRLTGLGYGEALGLVPRMHD